MIPPRPCEYNQIQSKQTIILKGQEQEKFHASGCLQTDTHTHHTHTNTHTHTHTEVRVSQDVQFGRSYNKEMINKF